LLGDKTRAGEGVVTLRPVRFPFAGNLYFNSTPLYIYIYIYIYIYVGRIAQLV